MRLHFYFDCSFKAMSSDLAIRITYVDGHVYIVGPHWRVFKYTEANSLLAFGICEMCTHTQAVPERASAYIVR